MDYRDLDENEPIQPGDEYQSHYTGDWYATNGVDGKTPKLVAALTGLSKVPYRRPIPAPCPPTQRNTGTCERCRDIDEVRAENAQLRAIVLLADEMRIAKPVRGQQFRAFHAYDTLRERFNMPRNGWEKSDASRARPEIEGNDG